MEPGRSLLETAMLRWLDELSSQGVVATDVNLRITSWNRWLERHSGIAPADVVGEHLITRFPEIAERGFEPYYRAALEGEISILAQQFHRYLIEVPARIESPGSSPMPQSCRIAPLTAGNEIVGTITVIEDVSDRVRSEAELRRQITSADQARQTAEQALRLKDEFLATLSHEIRTPLNAVIGWTRMLLSRPVDAATLDNALKVIDRNARAQSRLVEDMLDMARIISGKLRLVTRVVDLKAVTEAAVDVVSPAAAAKGVRITTEFDGSPPAIIADPDRVQQIAWNLLSNAVKFSPPGGTVHVAISAEPEVVRLVVSDTGQGIAPEFLPYVFERFRQANASTNRSEGGLGLGLALVRQLVELHGGRITAESAGLGRGAVFTVVLPNVVPDGPGSSPDPAVLAGTPLQGIRTLLVEDDSDWRQLLALALREFGADVLTASTAREGLDLLLAKGPHVVDVILADIGLPVEDGYAFLGSVRALGGEFERLPAVAVTAYAGAASESRALAAGFQLQCSKPLDPHDVASAILRVLDRPSAP